ncbi:MAG TPA: hypothetical protein VNP20_07595 [Nocardioidaceae bacterium]|nr:hypothetical protein [Nocardioidaceae bacterium]
MNSPRILNMPKAFGPDAAREALRRHAYGALTTARLLRAAPTDELRGFERVLVPCWVIGLDVVTATRGRRDKVDQTRARVFLDCLSRECRAVPEGAGLEEGDPVAGVEDPADRVSADEARELAGQALRWQLLRSGGANLRDLSMSAATAEPCHLPVWLGYFGNDRGRIRVRCLSGADGGVESAAYAMKVLRMLQEPATV